MGIIKNDPCDKIGNISKPSKENMVSPNKPNKHNIIGISNFNPIDSGSKTLSLALFSLSTIDLQDL